MISSQTSDLVLKRDLDRYKAEHPGCTQEEAVNHAVKFTIPPSVAGSPARWREELHNLVRRAEVGWVLGRSDSRVNLLILCRD